MTANYAIAQKELQTMLYLNADKSILVVDDNTNNLKLVHHLLDEQGYTVRLATNGKLALASVKSNCPDLILLDISMPVMDGYTACDILKKDLETSHIPIIFLSAIKDPVDIVKGFNVGGVDYVTKPFKPEVLLARVNTHLMINHLQSELRQSNENLEKRVKTKTWQFGEVNGTLIEEIQQRILTEERLSESEEFHRLTLENLGETIVITTDIGGNITFISSNIENILEYTVDEVNQFGTINKLLTGDKPGLFEGLNHTEIEVRSKNGDVRTLGISIHKIHIRTTIIIYTCQDITERKLIEKERTESSTRLKHALTVSNEGIWDWDIGTDKVIYNDTFFAMLGYSPIDPPIKGHIWLDLLHQEDSEKCKQLIDNCIEGRAGNFKMEYRLKESNGGYLWIHAQGKIVECDNNGNPKRFVGTHTNIQTIKESEALLKHQASYDSLTKLPNRALFFKMLENAIAQAKRSSFAHAVLFIDLDRFKNINDSLGHSAGDKLLKDVSDRIFSVLRETDTVARLGGDEFTVLLERIGSPHKAVEIANRIIDILTSSFNLLGHEVIVSPSIGIVIYPDHGSTPEELLKNADTAMYCSKGRGGNCFEFYTEEMNKEVNVRLELEADLRNAVKKNEIIQYYQPQVDLGTGSISGFESLARWQRQGQFVPPSIFIPVAEETGLIIPMGRDILTRSLEDAKGWMQSAPSGCKISINISAVQFRQKSILTDIDLIIEKANLPVEYIELELTEAAVMEDIDSGLQLMKDFKDRGLALALDDFGTGYSSLSYLKKFPIDTLKIDMSFIKDIDLSDENRNIVKSIIDLAHNLKLKVVAEGVETAPQLAILRDIGCDTIQGYFYSKPMDKLSVHALLKNQTNLY